MNRILSVLILLSIISTTFGCVKKRTVSPANPAPAGMETGRQIWTCSMHPSVRKDKPGQCPICGMDLVPAKDIGGSRSGLPESILIDPATQQNMGLRIAAVGKGPLRRVIRTVGNFDYDETALTDVTVKFPGWLETLYVDSTGKQVHAGDPLFEIYAPELYSAQSEYLLTLQASARMSSESSAPMLASVKNKLKFFDISDEQIKNLEETKEAKRTLKINAQRNGVVIEKNAVQGMKAEAGQLLYRLADLSTVWLQTQVYEQDMPFIKLGQEATASLSYFPDRKFRGRITYVYPYVDEKTRTGKVRLEFHNPGYFLKPGMFANVEIVSELETSVVLVPDTAVLRSGEKNTVFIRKEGGYFEPREIILGYPSENNMYQVLQGLSEGEIVVTSGQFLLDSESHLREAIQKMQEPQSVDSETFQLKLNPVIPDGGTDKTLGLSGTKVEPLVYVCPMPEHVSIIYKVAGICPICKMKLIPITDGNMPQVNSTSALTYYTCPMPEHSDVRETKPGKCPRCGMTLIPMTTQSPQK